MSVEDIKHSIEALSASERNEVSAYLFYLRHASDPGYQDRVSERLADTDKSHWLTPEEFERRLGQE